MSLTSVLFVCTGNICRSPMAEMMWNYDGGLLPASSAGLEAETGNPIDRRAASVLKSAGITVTPFVARQFTFPLAQDNVVITMTQTQEAKVASLVPSAYPRTFTLNKLACLINLHPDKPLTYLHQRRNQASSFEIADIADPVHSSEAVFRSIAVEIQDALDVLKESPIFLR